MIQENQNQTPLAYLCTILATAPQLTRVGCGGRCGSTLLNLGPGVGGTDAETGAIVVDAVGRDTETLS